MKHSILILLLSFSYLSIFAADITWYRGNTHVHTKLCGHADSHPDVVAKWYLDNGYNFLILSEHNIFIDPAKVNLPKDRRKDFVLVPGQEITGKKVIHTTAMNIKALVPWKYDNKDKSKIIQSHVDGTIKEGGHAILNHPNFRHAVTADDMFNVKNLYMFELYNGHPHVENEGNDKKHVHSTEDVWDELLTKGMKIYGVSSDDAHHFKKREAKLSNPGRGWVMVNSNGLLNPAALTEAMVKGQFYSSNGIFLKTCEKNSKAYSIEIDAERTEKEIAKKHVAGKVVKDIADGYVIDFIADKGKVLSSQKGLKGQLKVPDGISYLRVKITLTKSGIQYYAWGQPVFLDDRAK